VSNEQIRTSMKQFDLSSDAEALKAIDEMMGEVSTVAGSEEENGSMPLSDALAAVQFRESPLWSTILDGLKNIAADLQKHSENLKLLRDERLSALDQLQGVKKAMTFVGQVFSEAEQRVSNIDTTEKTLIGPEGRKISESARAKVAPQVDATKSAIAFLSKATN